MKQYFDQFKKLSLTSRLSLFVALLLFFTIGITINNALTRQEVRTRAASNNPPANNNSLKKSPIAYTYVTINPTNLYCLGGKPCITLAPTTPQYCLQVLTPARNLTTKKCKTFPTSCIPNGWIADPTCSVTTPAPSPTPTSTPKYCLQVLTPARNLTTKKCKTFPTSCIPNGWIADPTCSTTSPTQTPTPIPTISPSNTPTTTPSCSETVTDVDGNVYNTVKIGAQCWMKENLKTGNKINNTSNQTNNGIIEKYCYDNLDANCSTDGGLYQWNEAMGYVTTEGAQGICPTGWHVPKDSEWNTLENYLKDAGQTCNGNRDLIWDCATAGTKLKQGGTSGFEGILAGYRWDDTNAKRFEERGLKNPMWTSLQSGNYAWNRALGSEYATTRRSKWSKNFGYAVRCINNNTPTPTVEPTQPITPTPSVSQTPTTTISPTTSPCVTTESAVSANKHDDKDKDDKKHEQDGLIKQLLELIKWLFEQLRQLLNMATPTPTTQPITPTPIVEPTITTTPEPSTEPTQSLTPQPGINTPTPTLPPCEISPTLIQPTNTPIPTSIPSSIKVTSPNGGEKWAAGTAHNITWKKTDNAGANVKIELLKNGTVVGTVTSSTPNDGSHSWTIWNKRAPGIDYKIKITDIADNNDYDESDKNFTIVSPVKVVTPNGGEKWEIGKQYTISWSTTSNIEQTQVDLYKGGKFVKTIVSVIKTNLQTTTTPDSIYKTSWPSIKWTPDASLIAGNNYKIRVTDPKSGNYDQSDKNFSILSPVKVVTPNGKESWEKGKAYAITWNTTSSVGQVSIDLYKGGKLYKNLLGSGSSLKAPATSSEPSYSSTWSMIWTPDSSIAIGDDYKIRVTDSISKAFDESDNNFSITTATITPTIKVVLPNGGEKWIISEQNYIKWSTTGDIGYVKIDLYKGGTFVKNLFKDIISIQGSVSWTPELTTIPGNDYKIRITKSLSDIVNNPTDKTSIYDESDNNFSILSPVKVVTPNGGEKWEKGKEHTITWNTTSAVGQVSIDLYKGGKLYKSLVGQGTLGFSEDITIEAPDYGSSWSMIWTPDSSIAIGDDYKIRVTDSISKAFDESDNNFSITPLIYELK